MVWQYKKHGSGKYRIRIMIFDEEYREIYKDTDVELTEGLSDALRFCKTKLGMFLLRDLGNPILKKEIQELRAMKEKEKAVGG